MTKRGIIGWAVVIAIVLAAVSVISLVRRPVLSAPLRRPSLGLVARAPAVVDRAIQPSREECSSTAFIDYANDARGKATVRAAVRAYRPGARNLRINIFLPKRAVVEEFRGTTRIATYELFRTKKTGWLVDRAEIYAPCSVG